MKDERYFLFSPLFGEDSQVDKYFSAGLKPPTSIFHCFLGEDWMDMVLHGILVIVGTCIHYVFFKQQILNSTSCS